MDFPGMGVISYDPPSEDLKPFMRRKIRNWISTWGGNIHGVIYRSDHLKEVEEHVKRFPEGERAKAAQDRTALWDFVIMCDKPGDSIPEEEIVEAYINRIFDASERRKSMGRHKEFAVLFFKQIDLNHDGVIDFEEYVKGCKVVSRETVRMVFDAIDANNDGFIQLDEFLYAVLYFMFSSGPDSPLSLMFGPVPEGEK